jgi:6-phosphogluconolactonase (cycloisomerase 2 family)
VEDQLNSSHRVHRGKRLTLLGFALSLLALVAMSSSASAANKPKKPKKPAPFSHGAVFTETNAVKNSVLAYSRLPGGKLKLVGKFRTGGNGHPSSNPPAAFPTLDSAGAVGLSPTRNCLFVVNAGSNTVSSFRVTSRGLKLVNHPSSRGIRPISLTSTIRAGKQLLYVLNSDANSANIHGFQVAPSCRLSDIKHSTRPTTSQKSVPAQIRFDTRGQVLAVSERFANDIDVFPVTNQGVAGSPVVTHSSQNTPYGLEWNNRDILAVSNEDFPPPAVANSTVTTYSLQRNGKLVALHTVASPGAACWNVFTNNGKFLFVTNPAGPLFGGNNVQSFRVGTNGSMSGVGSQDTAYNSLDDALSKDNKYLYVLSDQLLPVQGPHSAINAFKVNAGNGKFGPIGAVAISGNSTAGLAVL